ncbi:MAG: hypothetical protein CMJ64_20115 [Planctomycetaceae bacterium]|nr:hypothetical protein [Planctomycetaceae bacterium]
MLNTVFGVQESTRHGATLGKPASMAVESELRNESVVTLPTAELTSHGESLIIACACKPLAQNFRARPGIDEP